MKKLTKNDWPPSPLTWLPLACPFFHAPTTSKHLLRRLVGTSRKWPPIASDRDHFLGGGQGYNSPFPFNLLKGPPHAMVWSLCSLYYATQITWIRLSFPLRRVQYSGYNSEYEKNFKRQHDFTFIVFVTRKKMHVIHFLQKLDLSRLFLIEDLLQFNSHKRLTLHNLGGHLREVRLYMKC